MEVLYHVPRWRENDLPVACRQMNPGLNRLTADVLPDRVPVSERGDGT